MFIMYIFNRIELWSNMVQHCSLAHLQLRFNRQAISEDDLPARESYLHTLKGGRKVRSLPNKCRGSPHYRKARHVRRLVVPAFSRKQHSCCTAECRCASFLVKAYRTDSVTNTRKRQPILACRPIRVLFPKVSCHRQSLTTCVDRQVLIDYHHFLACTT